MKRYVIQELKNSAWSYYGILDTKTDRLVYTSTDFLFIVHSLDMLNGIYRGE